MTNIGELADVGADKRLTLLVCLMHTLHPLMERYYRSHRPVLFELLDAIELEATSTDHTVLDAVEFLTVNRHRIGEYIPDHHDGQPVDLSFAGDMWHKTLRDRHRPHRLRRRHFEVCVFAHLASELRTGDIAVAGSDSYANLHAQLMSWTECEPLVAGYCTQAGLPATAAECVARWRQELTTVAAAVDAGYPDNADLCSRGAGRCSHAAPARSAASPRWRWRPRFTSGCPNAGGWTS